MSPRSRYSPSGNDHIKNKRNNWKRLFYKPRKKGFEVFSDSQFLTIPKNACQSVELRYAWKSLNPKICYLRENKLYAKIISCFLEYLVCVVEILIVIIPIMFCIFTPCSCVRNWKAAFIQRQWLVTDECPEMGHPKRGERMHPRQKNACFVLPEGYTPIFIWGG